VSALPYPAASWSQKTEGGFIEVELRDGSHSASEVIQTFENLGLEIYEIRRQEMTLEQVFFNLTESNMADGKQARGKSPSAGAT
jgi:hypothetical protein